MVGHRWHDLSPRNRAFLLTAVVAETAVKAVAMADLVRRPAAEIRGSKWVWGPAIAVVNSFGLVPLCYFVLGRRPRKDEEPAERAA